MVRWALPTAAGPDDLPAPTEGPEPARRRAVEILSRDEFREEQPTLLDRFWEWLSEQVARVLGQAGSASALLGWAVVLVLLGLAVALVVVVLRRVQRDPVRRGGGVSVDDVGRAAADWRAEAARHEAAGAHRDALRCHWRALLADLAQRGLVEEVPGRTTGEYRRRLARAVPGAAHPFDEATGLFEVAWYGQREVGPGEVADERRLGDAVLAEARR